MIEDQYSVNIYFVVVFDINLDVTSFSLLAAGFSAFPVVFLVSLFFRNKIISATFRQQTKHPTHRNNSVGGVVSCERRAVGHPNLSFSSNAVMLALKS